MQLSPEILSLMNEAALIVRGDNVEYANSAANKVFGKECKDHSLSMLIGNDLASIQANAFVTEKTLKGKSYIIRITRTEKMRVVIMEPADMTPVFINDAFLVAMKNVLMDVSVLTELQCSRSGAEKTGEMRLHYYRIRRLVNNVSILRDICTGEPMLKPSQFSVRELCDRIILTVEGLMPSVDIRLRCDDEALVTADREYVTQILLNLLSNCLIHADGLNTVTITVRTAKTGKIISVGDDGCGIGPEKLSRIFEAYKRTPSLSDMSRGAGLGLAAARGMAAALGGTILMETRPGKGTVVSFSVPGSSDSKILKSSSEPLNDLSEDVIIGLSDCLSAQAVDRE